MIRRRSDWRWLTLGIASGAAIVMAGIIAVWLQVHPTVVQSQENCHEAIAFWTKYAAIQDRIAAKQMARFGKSGPGPEAQALAALDREHASKIACR